MGQGQGGRGNETGRGNRGGCVKTYQKGVPTKELAGDLREADPKSAEDSKKENSVTRVSES